MHEIWYLKVILQNIAKQDHQRKQRLMRSKQMRLRRKTQVMKNLFLFKVGNNNRSVYQICVEDDIINMIIDNESTFIVSDETT